MRLVKHFILCLLFTFFLNGTRAQSSLYMPGATNWVSVGDLDVSGNQLTVEALVYYTGASVNIVSKHTNPGDVNYLLRLGVFEITTTSGYANFGGVSAAGVTLSPNRMYHVAATYDGAMLKYYINGCLTGSMAWTGNMIQNNLITAIGNQSACQCEQFTGYIDEVRIWNVARTQAQIAANMLNLPSPTTQPGLLGYWKFDGTMTNLQGNTTFDGVAMGAPQYQSIPLPYPSALHESVTSSDPICTGDINGLINVSAVGYYTPYEYSLDGVTYGSSSSFPNLPAGTYTVYTRPQNNNSCVVSSPITLTDPPILNPNLTTTNVTCNGANNGTAAIAPSGGDGATYRQIWSPSLNTTTSLTNLAPGNYSVTVSDTCRASGPELVTNGHFENGNTGFNYGSYTYGGAGPNTLAVDVDPSYYNGGFVGVGYGGGGNFLVVDGTTVPGTSFFCETITVSPNTYYNLSAFVSSMNTTSTAVIDFQINGVSVGTLNAPGATSVWSPFQTTWFSGASTTANLCLFDQNTIGGGNDFGVDNISFKSCASCTATLPFTITEPTALSLSTLQTNVSCNGGTNGTATVTANGGTTPYSYSWNTAPVQTTATATNLPAGSYTATVTDANLCTATISVTITEPPVLTAMLSAQTNISCNGMNDGTATVIAGGGSPGYSYSWNTAPVQTTVTATNLSAGAYTATVTDLNGCTATANVTITEPTALSVVLTSQTNVSCNGGNNGAATITANGGTTAYAYTWNSSPAQFTNVATNLTAGTYTCVVSDNHSCMDSATVTITEPPLLTLALTAQTNVLCNGGNTGSATVLANGGTPALSYSWNTVPVQNTATASNLIAGNYIATVTDLNSCIDTVHVTITQPPVLSLVLATKTNPSCFGVSDASIHLTAAGGMGAYTFVWSPNVSTADSAVAIPAGSYTITVTDANSCTQNITVVVTDPPLLTVNATATPGAICITTSTTLNAVTAGGTGTLTYSWSNAAMTASQTIFPIATTNYTVTVTDAMSCTAIDSVPVTVFVPAAIHLGNDTSICQGDVLTLNAGGGFLNYVWQNGSTGGTFNASTSDMYFVNATDNHGCHSRDTLILTVNPLPVCGLADSVHICPGIATTLTANPGYTTYLWDTGAGTNSITTATAGTYNVVITDANGCVNTDSTKVIVYPVPTLSFIVQPLTGCSPMDVSVTNTTNLNGSSIQTWAWAIGPNNFSVTEPSVTLNAGTYNLSLQATTTNGCIVDTLLTNYITVHQSPTAIIGASTMTYELFNDSIYLSNQSINADSYEWYLFNGLYTQTTDLGYPISDTGHFNFELVALTNFGCVDSTDITIWVKPSFALYFPNAFTPNPNGLNDVFMPKGYGIHTFEMLIFDRWGELVFKSNDLYTGWDGTFHGKDLPSDVYVYRVSIRDEELNPHSYIGHVTIVR